MRGAGGEEALSKYEPDVCAGPTGPCPTPEGEAIADEAVVAKVGEVRGAPRGGGPAGARPMPASFRGRPILEGRQRGGGYDVSEAAESRGAERQDFPGLGALLQARRGMAPPSTPGWSAERSRRAIG